MSFVPLRERRQQERDSVPGQQHPWAAFVAPSMDSSAIMAHTSSQNPSIPWHLDSSLIDPFGMLPIKMAFRSRELLHYCGHLSLHPASECATRLTVLLLCSPPSWRLLEPCIKQAKRRLVRRFDSSPPLLPNTT